MKKIISTVLLLTLLFMLLPVGISNDSVKSEVKRKVLLELFTATWCGPCAAYGPNVDKLYDEVGGDKVILLRDQVWNDGLNTEETNERCNFYGVTGVPTLFVNGKYQYHPMNYNDYKAKVNEILLTQPACAIQLNPAIQSGKNIGVISIDINSISNVNSNNTFLVVALYEKLVNYEGTNKVKTHRFVIRDYIFDELGKKISLNKGETLSYTLPFTLKDGANPQDFGVVVWLQDYSTMEVLQAESKDISVLNKPTPPTIVSPEDNSKIANLPLSIKWLSSINNCKIQISDKNDFSNIIADQNTTDDKLTISSINPGTYFLRIKAIDNSSESDWSKTYKFTYSSGEAIPGWKDYNTNLYGGDVTSIVQDPVNTNVFYAGTYGGGVFKSVDSCKTWVRTSIGLDCLYVNSLAIDNSNPNNIFAGTNSGVYISKNAGKSWYLAWGMNAQKINYADRTKTIYAFYYDNFVKSSDYGKTWTQIKLPISDEYYFYAFAVDLQNQNTILVSTYTYPEYIPMLYISTDNGTTWKKALQLDKYQFIESIAIDNNHNIYLATSGRGLLKSIDNGNTFNKSTTQFNYVYSVSVSPVNPNIVAVAFGSVYISFDGGNTFKRTISGDNVTFDRTKEERIIVGNSTTGISISEDKGNSWKEQNTGLTAATVAFIITSPSVFVQTPMGLFEYNKTWNRISNYGLGGGKLFQNPKNSEQLVLIQTYSICISNTAGKNFSIYETPTNTYMQYSASSDVDFNNNLIYSVLYDYNENKYYPCKIDFNGNYTKITTVPADIKYPSGVIIVKDSPSTIYLGTELYWDSTNNVYKGGGLYRSLDGGKTWNLLSLKDESIYNLFSDPKNSKVMYANTGSGLKKSTDGGLSWKVVLPQQVNIMTFHNTESVIYATNGRNVLKSKDDGNTWSFIPWDYSVDLVKFSTINSIAIDTVNSDSFFIGTDGGVYKYELSNIVTFTITASAGSGGTITPSGSVTVNSGEVKAFVITPDTGYKIKDVKVDGISVGAVSSYTFTNITSNHTIEAIFEAMTLTYSITASAGSGGTITPSGSVTVNSGEVKAFVITPDTGYKIKDVKVDGISVGAVSSYTFTNITSNHTIEAVFEAMTLTYSITASAGSGGTISPSGNITVNSGEVKTFIITPDTGYKIKDVKVDGVSIGAVSSYTFTNITSNHTIEAIFEKQTTQIVIILRIGNTNFTVNGETRTLDSPPIIKNGRTLLPIRAIVEALGGSVTWHENEKSIDIVLGNNHLILQIGNPNAYVNGIQKFIDPSNLKVVPEIINGRTMLPLRFVAESLGCDVQWDGDTKTVTITYVKSGG